LLNSIDYKLGTNFEWKFDNNKMITGEELNKLAGSLGMIVEPPRNFELNELQGSLNRGPIWALVGVPDSGGLTHSWIINHIDADPSDENGTIHYYDPSENANFSIDFKDFRKGLELLPQQLDKLPQPAKLHGQIIHF
jgi:hypothetical protein